MIDEDDIESIYEEETNYEEPSEIMIVPIEEEETVGISSQYTVIRLGYVLLVLNVPHSIVGCS